MTWTLIVGLLLTAIALTIAGRRVWWLYRLITSGQPAPGRVEGVTKRLGAAVKGQLVEVFGQRKLLTWSVPGAAHFFVFWAFLILATVYLEAYGALFNPDFAIPVVGHWAVLGFLQDFIAVMAFFGLRHLRVDPDQELTRAARPAVPVQGLPPRGRLAGALHDLQRLVDDVPVPRGRLGGRQPALRQRRLRLDRASATSWTA